MNGERTQNRRSNRTGQYYLGVTFVLIILFVALRPEGAPSDAWLPTVLFWATQISVTMLLLVGLQSLLQFWSPFNGLNPWIKIILIGVLCACLLTPFSLIIDQLFGDPDGQAPIWSMSGFLEELGNMGPPTILTWLAINIPLLVRFDRLLGTDTLPDEKASLETRPSEIAEGIFSKIKPEIGRDIQSMSAELHYVRVQTLLGTDLVLYNFSQAIKEMKRSAVFEDAGLQIHRSHWVNMAAIKNLKVNSQGGYVILNTDERLPVSRRRVAEIKDHYRRFMANSRG